MITDESVQSKDFIVWKDPETGRFIQREIMSESGNFVTLKADAIRPALSLHINEIADLRANFFETHYKTLRDGDNKRSIVVWRSKNPIYLDIDTKEPIGEDLYADT